MTIVSRFLKDPQALSLNELKMLRYKCETDFLFFCRVFFFVRTGLRFLVNWHHILIAETLQRVIDREISRLVINIPPRYTKTEMAVILFLAYSLVLNKRSLSMHISYSDELALGNSDKVREIVTSEQFQTLWPRKVRRDASAKKRWYTEDGGGMMAAASGGQITGFGVGLMEDVYSGALVLDDPIKPEDAYSSTVRRKVNNRVPDTLRSRLNLPSHPVITIGQRVHEDDTTGFLLRGGNGDIWHHLCIPLDGEDSPYDYPSDYTHAIPIQYERPVRLLWELKHDLDELEKLLQTPYTYASQYAQRPAPLGGGLFKQAWWQFYDDYNYAKNIIYVGGEKFDQLLYKMAFADTAQKTGEHNDYSVGQVWGYGEKGNIYLLDQIRGKWEAPDLRSRFLEFFDRHEFKADGREALIKVGLRDRFVEDKVSGTGLIQDINRERGFNFVKGIQRDKDKVSRANGCIPLIHSGRVYLPKNAPWISEYLYEFSMFTPEMSHAHDDQIDPTMDAVQHMLIDRKGAAFMNIF